MLLNDTQLNKLQAWTTSQGMKFIVKASPAGAFGSIQANHYLQRVSELMIVNSTEGTHEYVDAQGVDHSIRVHDPRKTLAHEYTHILQVKNGHYLRADYDITRNYNEVVANTIGMLCFPTENNIIDNAGYVNRYINRKGVKSMVNLHLEDDINTLYPQVLAFLQSLGIL